MLPVVCDELLGGLRLLLADAARCPSHQAAAPRSKAPTSNSSTTAGRPARPAHRAGGRIPRAGRHGGARPSRPRPRTSPAGSSRSASATDADVVAVGPRVDRQHVVAVCAERPGETTRACADLEHARGRLRRFARTKDLSSTDAIRPSSLLLLAEPAQRRVERLPAPQYGLEQVTVLLHSG